MHQQSSNFEETKRFCMDLLELTIK